MQLLPKGGIHLLSFPPSPFLCPSQLLSTTPSLAVTRPHTSTPAPERQSLLAVPAAAPSDDQLLHSADHSAANLYGEKGTELHALSLSLFPSEHED